MVTHLPPSAHSAPTICRGRASFPRAATLAYFSNYRCVAVAGYMSPGRRIVPLGECHCWTFIVSLREALLDKPITGYNTRGVRCRRRTGVAGRGGECRGVARQGRGRASLGRRGVNHKTHKRATENKIRTQVVQRKISSYDT